MNEIMSLRTWEALEDSQRPSVDNSRGWEITDVLESWVISHRVSSFSPPSHNSVFIFSSRLCLKEGFIFFYKNKFTKSVWQLTVDQLGLAPPCLFGRQMVGPTHGALYARVALAYPKIYGYICGICWEWKGESQGPADAWMVRRKEILQSRTILHCNSM